MRYRLSIAIILCINNLAHAQYDTRVNLVVGNFSNPDLYGARHFRVELNTVGLAIEQRIFKSFGLNVTYTAWVDLYANRKSIFNKTVQLDAGPIATWGKGTVTEHSNFKMLDVLVWYKYYMKRHVLNLELGTTYCYGLNGVIISVYNHPGYPDWLINSEAVKAGHLGFAYNFGYDFLFSKNRLNIGASFNGRHYSGAFKQYTINLNIGYNFNVKLSSALKKTTK